MGDWGVDWGNFDSGASDVSYSGLTDTADSFSGAATTLDSLSTVGSSTLSLGTEGVGPLQSLENDYAVGSPSDLDTLNVNTVMGEVDPLSSANITSQNTLSGVTNPAPGAAVNTPTSQAVGTSQETASLLGGFAKFGSTIGALLGNHPATVSGSTTKGAATTTAAGAAVTAGSVISGSSTIMLAVVVVALGLLLLKGK